MAGLLDKNLLMMCEALNPAAPTCYGNKPDLLAKDGIVIILLNICGVLTDTQRRQV